MNPVIDRYCDFAGGPFDIWLRIGLFALIFILALLIKIALRKRSKRADKELK